METGLHGKSAVITGAASGLGRAMALALAAEGAQVVVADLNEASGQAVVAEITAAGGVARFVACDVTVEASVAALVSSILAQEGALHVMINNAGVGPQQGPLIQSTTEDWDRVYAVNLRGVFLGIKYAALAMLARGTPTSGSIINLASVAGLGAAPLLGPYGPTKAGVIELTQTAAIELAQTGIRVNAICPGWIETPILGDAERSQFVRQIPLKRIGQPEDVASMAVYLASDAAAFVTGSAFRVDGGMRS